MPFVADPPQKSSFAPAPTGVVADPSQVTPNAEELLRQKEAVAVRTGVRKEKERLVRENADAGIPLNPEMELPAGMRSRASFESNIDKQVELLGKQEGVLSARKSKDGRNVIVRMNDENGNPRDILLHPKGAFSAGDVAGAAGPLLKMGATATAAGLTGGASLVPTALAMGGTAAATEALSSGGSRVLAGQDIDPAQLTGAALKEGAINAAIPVAVAGGKAGAQAIGRALTSGAGALEKNLPLAAERLGVGTTLAETTGSPTIAKLGKLTSAEEEARQMALRMAKDRGTVLSGGKPAPLASEAEVAGRAQPIFSEAEQAAEKGVRTAMTDAEKAAQAKIQTELDSGIIPTTRTTSEIGDFIRNKIAGKAANSKTAELRAGAENLYGAANALAEAEGVTVTPTALTALRKELDADTSKALLDFAPGIKKIPQLERMLTEEVVTDTGMVDAAGKKILQTTPPPPLTVPQARELRSVVYDLAHTAGPPGEGGVPRRYLTRLYKALDDDLRTAVNSGSDELKAAHAAADDFYKTKIQPLQQSDVSKLFLETDAAGRMGGDEIVRRLFRGDGNLDALRAYREVLGKDSPEFKLLVRQGLQTVLEDAGALTGRVDAAKFLTRLNQLGKTELADEIIGPVAKTLRTDAKLMARAQGQKIPIDELEDALASPSQVTKLLNEAIGREQSYEKAYQGTIQKQLRDGALGPRTMGSVDDFVTRFVESPHASTADIRQALTQIAGKSPEVAEQVRQRVLQNVLDNAGAKPALGKVTTRETEDLSHEVLADVLKGDSRSRLQSVIGEKGIQFLDDLATYAEATAKRIVNEEGRKVAPETMAKEVASGAIGFKRNAIGALVDAGAAVSRKLGGGALVRNPSVRAYLERGELPALVNAVAPAARTATLAAPEIKNAVDALVGERTLTPAEVKDAEPGPFRGTNGKRYEKLPNGRIESR